MANEDPILKAANELARKAADRGQLIELGWVAFRRLVLAEDASGARLAEMRLAYRAGAQHLFATIIGIMDQGHDPTAADLHRMDLLAGEAAEIEKELRLLLANTKGSS